MPVEIVPMVFALVVVAACWQPPARRKRARIGLVALRRGVLPRAGKPEIHRRYAAVALPPHRAPGHAHDAAAAAGRQRERRAAGFVAAANGHHAAFAPSGLPPIGFSLEHMANHAANHKGAANAVQPGSDLDLLHHVLVGEAAQAELDRRRSAAEAGTPQARNGYVRPARSSETMTG